MGSFLWNKNSHVYECTALSAQRWKVPYMTVNYAVAGLCPILTSNDAPGRQPHSSTVESSFRKGPIPSENVTCSNLAKSIIVD